jgi:rapamycin-insensitive companion of mTOR
MPPHVYVRSVFPDEFRSILQQASSLIMVLATAGRTPASPPASPGSSSPLADPISDAEVNRVRAEAMTKLLGMLQRNLSIRLELDVAQVVKAYVSGIHST